MDQALVTMDPATGKMTISGKDPIDVSKDQSIAQSGARIAAQMGLSAEEFTQFINKQNLKNPMVSQNVVGFDTFDTTRAKAYVTEDNLKKLNDALVYKLKIGDVAKTEEEGRRNSFRRSITEIAGPARVNVEVLDDDTVIVGDITIPNGITKPQEVLEAIEASKKPKKKKLPQ